MTIIHKWLMLHSCAILLLELKMKVWISILTGMFVCFFKSSKPNSRTCVTVHIMYLTVQSEILSLQTNLPMLLPVKVRNVVLKEPLVL